MKYDIEELLNNDQVSGLYRYRLQRMHKNIIKLIDLISTLEKNRFSVSQFRDTRTTTGTQSEWGRVASVSQASIGKWERGDVDPSYSSRNQLLVAARIFREYFESSAESLIERGINFNELKIDPNKTRNALNETILKAALTDFNYDALSNKIIAVNFDKDEATSIMEGIEDDKRNLLDSLQEQSDILIESLSEDANINSNRIVNTLKRYRDQCLKAKPNPRMVHRFGTTFSRCANDDDIRLAISNWDDVAIDGFIDDHNELMRLYFRAALAHAQEVDAATIDTTEEEPSADDFIFVANSIEELQLEDGSKLVEGDIPIILRDIAREIQEMADAEELAYSVQRKGILRRRRREAIKNASIFVGRFLFCTTLFIVITPNFSLGAAGSIASIIGLLEAAAPGTIRSTYDRLRESIPILPKLPENHQ